MLDTAGQSSQALLFCLRYDFPTAVVGVRERHRGLRRHAGEAVLPLFGAERQEADDRRADAVRGERGEPWRSVTPAEDLAGLSAGLSGAAGQAPLSLPADATVMTREPVPAGIPRPAVPLRRFLRVILSEAGASGAVRERTLVPAPRGLHGPW